MTKISVLGRQRQEGLGGLEVGLVYIVSSRTGGLGGLS